MRAVSFEGMTGILGQPSEWDSAKHGPCTGLPVHYEEGTFMSVWRPSLWERLQILIGRNVCLAMVSGQHPPVALEITKAKTLGITEARDG